MLNPLIETVIKDRFQLTTLKVERMRSSAYYEDMLQLACDLKWDELEAMLRRSQIITTRTDMRHTKEQP